MPHYRLLHIPQNELDLDYTLPCGQAFRWRRSPDGWWVGVVRETLLRLRQTEAGIEWQTWPRPDDFDLLRDCFRLDDDAPAIYAALAAKDEHLAVAVERFRGLRLLRQAPAETLLSFICSAANSIPRISAAIEVLSRTYGSRVATLEQVDYHAFPTVSALAAADASRLEKTAGLGFRGPALKNVAAQILQRPEGWLESLRLAPYEMAVAELLAIRGVGRKIADCVCLFSLDKDEAVPVDTHVRSLAARLYMPDLKAKTVTAASYARISNYFRQRFRGLAGWAQQFLYYEDLLRSRGETRVKIPSNPPSF